MSATNERDAVSSLIADLAKNLIDGHYHEIRDIADEPDENGEAGNIKFTLKVELDFCGKTPAGAVNISIQPRAIRDGSTFRVEDSEQEKLPLDGTTITMTTGDKTTGPIPLEAFDRAIDEVKRRGKK